MDAERPPEQRHPSVDVSELQRRARLPLSFRITRAIRRLIPGRAARAFTGSPAAVPLRRALNYGAPSEQKMVRVCAGPLEGAELLLDLSTEKYYWLGTHEEHVQRFLASEICAGDVVYDAGAHVGFFTVLMARLAGPSGRVYAFEPLPENVTRLRTNLDANRLGGVIAVRAALADHTGDAAFEPGPTTLEGRLAESGAAAVPVTTIDEYVREGFPPPTFIKIDVEGAEGSVLRGARETLAGHGPRLLIEVHAENVGAEIAGLLHGAYNIESLADGARVKGPLAPGHYIARPRRKKAA